LEHGINFGQFYIVIIVNINYSFLSENGNKQELMIIKALFEGPVGDYCIARNTIKCLFIIKYIAKNTRNSVYFIKIGGKDSEIAKRTKI